MVYLPAHPKAADRLRQFLAGSSPSMIAIVRQARRAERSLGTGRLLTARLPASRNDIRMAAPRQVGHVQDADRATGMGPAASLC